MKSKIKSPDLTKSLKTSQTKKLKEQVEKTTVPEHEKKGKGWVENQKKSSNNKGNKSKVAFHRRII